MLLSDHGQVPMTPFSRVSGAPLAELVAGWLPGFRVEELKGKQVGPAAEKAAGIVKLAYSGGLAHLYMAGHERRLDCDELIARHPGLLSGAISSERIALVMARRGGRDVFWSGGREVGGEALRRELERYDDPEILLDQLSRLNSFENSGDLVFIAPFAGDRQIDFENQAGGHGSIGGEQLHPFVLARREWEIDTSGVRGAHQLHPILSALRDRLAAGEAVPAKRA
jgi:hypothetical protein